MSLSEKEMEERLNKIHAIFEAEDTDTQDAVSEEMLEAFSNNIADVLSDLVERKVKEALDEKMAALAEGLPDAIEDYLDESIIEVKDELAENVSHSLACKMLNILEAEKEDDGEDEEAEDDGDEKCSKGKDCKEAEEDDKEDNAKDKKGGDNEEDEDEGEDKDSKNESYYNAAAVQILESLQDHMSYNEYQKIASMLDEQYFYNADDVRDFFESVVETDEDEPTAPVMESFVEFCARSMRV